MAEVNPNTVLEPWIGNICCEVLRNEHDWLFRFGDVGTVVVWSPWRIIADGGIAHADEDDGQKFGLPKPVDGAERTMKLLSGRKVVSVEVSPISGDLKIYFDSNRHLELFNNSSGYEGWHATVTKCGEKTSVIAQGGGQVSMLVQ